jgi:transcription elongation GreA/GreB family factor
MANEHAEKVAVGMWVKVAGFAPGEEEVFHIVPEGEADVLEQRIPPSNPLARALQGSKVGDTVPFRTPEGSVALTIVDAGKH